ncbi:Alpha/Beta hydrolase protein [Suillus spraguei]|nr:Alpha/Beta hydrolase protein [Suillus spraguei]
MTGPLTKFFCVSWMSVVGIIQEVVIRWSVLSVHAVIYTSLAVIKTLYAHGKRKTKKLRDGDEQEEATDDIFFDDTNSHIPAPPWTAVAPVRIPLQSCNQAADLLIQWFGPEDLKRIVGGEKWWQIRGLDGIDAEWIAEKSHLRPSSVHIDAGRKYSEEEKLVMSMEQLETTMLYIHGGGYYWGSINTHRYQIIKYAHKIRGRAFSVNYRKAPQYPWPCPLHDVLAAYLYLIQPPPDAAHKPIHPSKIVADYVSPMLTVLRDLGQPLPAGAVLISPWDIIPPHGFMNKPSVLWPMDPIKEGGRVARVHSDPLLKPCHADTPDADNNVTRDVPQVPPTDTGKHGDSTLVGSKQETSSSSALTVPQEKASLFGGKSQPSKVLMKNPRDVPLELRSQIQHYATTEQLSHPLVSPILQASLGNLCPLYILAGDGEVLRDEIIYMAHKAADPAKYPVREGVIRDGLRQRENVHKFSTPTKVHLQVYDGTFTPLHLRPFADYAYHSIAEFAKRVTQCSAEQLDRNPFPVLQRMPEPDVPSGAMNNQSVRTHSVTFLSLRCPPLTGRHADDL